MSYYQPPNGDEINFNLSLHQTLSDDINFELTNSEQHYNIPPGNTVNFEIDLYLPSSGNEVNFSLNAEDASINELLLNYQATSEMDAVICESIITDFTVLSTFDVVLDNSIYFNISINSGFNLEELKSGIILDALNYSATGLFGVDILRKSLEEILLVLSPDFKLLAYLEDYNDFVWNRRWRKVDDFKISVNKNKKAAKYLKIDNYIAKKQGDIVHAGKIKDREIKKDSSGESIQVSGKGLGEIFENRIAFNGVNIGTGYDSFSGSAESAMKYYVDVNVKNPDDVKREISNLIIEMDKSRGMNINYNARFQKISEILYEIAKTSGLGWDLQLDLEDKQFVFKVLNAKLKTGIRLNPRFDSVKMIDFKESTSKSENTVLIAGQGSGADRQVLEVSRNEV